MPYVVCPDDSLGATTATRRASRNIYKYALIHLRSPFLLRSFHVCFRSSMLAFGT